MSYNLYFHPKALKEWQKLDNSIKNQFKKLLRRRLELPRITSAALKSDLHDCYKIKLRQSGYRLVYQVHDKELKVLVIAIGQRDKSKIYKIAANRN
jgi:mRNA interferase RelE/StbE